MNDLIRPNLFRRTIHSSYFVTIGRALAVAQHFENVCRAIADGLDIKRAIRSGEASPRDVEFPAFVKGVRKRMLGGAVKTLGGLPKFPSEANAIFKAATYARNRIAHDSTVSVFEPLADEDALWSSLETLLKDVRLIVKADSIVCSLLYFMNERDPLPVPKDYEANVCEWVFSEFKGEDFLEPQYWVGESVGLRSPYSSDGST